MRRIAYSEAINEAIHHEMERDPRVFIYGIGVPKWSSIFGTTSGLVEKFGKDRCFDTPISEDAMTGFGMGAAIKGLRPIHVHIRVDFMILATNQIINMVSNQTYLSGGNSSVPMVIRTIIGRGWGQGAQHSKTLFSNFTHIPGLKVIAPTTPRDAKGMMISAIRENNPVICFEHRWLYWAKDEVPVEAFEIPIGKGNVLRQGEHLTIIAISWMNVEALQAAEIMTRHGISIEVIDPRTLFPLDIDLLTKSVRKTGFCLIADCDWISSGVSAEIAASINNSCFGHIKGPIERIGFAHTPAPTVRELENEFYPNAFTIVRKIEKMLGLKNLNLDDEDFFSHQRKFKGPF